MLKQLYTFWKNVSMDLLIWILIDHMLAWIYRFKKPQGFRDGSVQYWFFGSQALELHPGLSQIWACGGQVVRLLSLHTRTIQDPILHFLTCLPIYEEIHMSIYSPSADFVSLKNVNTAAYITEKCTWQTMGIAHKRYPIGIFC